MYSYSINAEWQVLICMIKLSYKGQGIIINLDTMHSYTGPSHSHTCPHTHDEQTTLIGASRITLGIVGS